MKFRMYVDEVGNADLGSSDDPNHRFLSLTGVVIDLDYVNHTLHAELEAIKAEFFQSHPDDPIIFHRKEMVSHKPPFQALADDVLRARFDERLIAKLTEWRYTVITVCIDKKRHREQYVVWRYDPYHYCMACLLERFVYFLRRRGGRGDVMSESRGGKEDMRLKSSFERLCLDGTDYLPAEQIQAALTSRQLKVKTKQNNIAGLQIADLIAHSSRCEVLHENDLFDRPLAPFAQRVIALLQQKYDRSGNRTFGKKLLG